MSSRDENRKRKRKGMKIKSYSIITKLTVPRKREEEASTSSAGPSNAQLPRRNVSGGATERDAEGAEELINPVDAHSESEFEQNRKAETRVSEISSSTDPKSSTQRGWKEEKVRMSDTCSIIYCDDEEDEYSSDASGTAKNISFVAELYQARNFDELETRPQSTVDPEEENQRPTSDQHFAFSTSSTNPEDSHSDGTSTSHAQNFAGSHNPLETQPPISTFPLLDYYSHLRYTPADTNSSIFPDYFTFRQHLTYRNEELGNSSSRFANRLQHAPHLQPLPLISVFRLDLGGRNHQSFGNASSQSNYYQGMETRPTTRRWNYYRLEADSTNQREQANFTGNAELPMQNYDRAGYIPNFHIDLPMAPNGSRYMIPDHFQIFQHAPQSFSRSVSIALEDMPNYQIPFNASYDANYYQRREIIRDRRGRH